MQALPESWQLRAPRPTRASAMPRSGWRKAHRSIHISSQERLEGLVPAQGVGRAARQACPGQQPPLSAAPAVGRHRLKSGRRGGGEDAIGRSRRPLATQKLGALRELRGSGKETEGDALAVASGRFIYARHCIRWGSGNCRRCKMSRAGRCGRILTGWFIGLDACNFFWSIRPDGKIFRTVVRSKNCHTLQRSCNHHLNTAPVLAEGPLSSSSSNYCYVSIGEERFLGLHVVAVIDLRISLLRAIGRINPFSS
jgi:hypothetical protein